MKRFLVVIGIAAIAAASHAQGQSRTSAGESDQRSPQLGFAPEQGKPGSPQLGFAPEQGKPGSPQLGFAPEQGKPGTQQLGAVACPDSSRGTQLGHAPRQDAPGSPQLGVTAGGGTECAAK